MKVKKKIRITDYRRKEELLSLFREMGIEVDENATTDALREKLRQLIKTNTGYRQGTVGDKLLSFLKQQQGKWLDLEEISAAIEEPVARVKNRIYIESKKGRIRRKTIAYFQYKGEKS